MSAPRNVTEYATRTWSSMKESLLEIICCPVDKGELELAVEEQDNDEILNGTLTCLECQEVYPIEDGIPNLLPPDMRESAEA